MPNAFSALIRIRYQCRDCQANLGLIYQTLQLQCQLKNIKKWKNSDDVHLMPFYRSHGAGARFSNGSDEHTHGSDYGAQLWGSSLNRLHMASGMGVAWILLADTIAGSFIILSLTGILLWTRLHGPRLLAAALGLGSLTFAIFFVWRAF